MTALPEMIIRYPALRTDTANGGGRMSKNAVPNAVRQNFLRTWATAEIQNGGMQQRKFFLHVANPDNDGLGQVGLILPAPTLADDVVTAFAGTPTDTVGTLPATPAEYGAGRLQSAAAAGATAFAVLLERSDLALFRTGDSIYVSGATNEEQHDGVTIVQAGAVVTVTLAAGDQLFNAYAAGSAVASVLPLGTVKASVGAPIASTVEGAIDAAQLVPDALGGVDQVITLTFTTPTTFSAVSDVKGALGTGSISAAFAPTNPDFARPYCTVPAAAWGGVWAAGQVVLFGTVSASAAFWLRGRLQAGAASTVDNIAAEEFGLRIIGGAI